MKPSGINLPAGNESNGTLFLEIDRGVRIWQPFYKTDHLLGHTVLHLPITSTLDLYNI